MLRRAGTTEALPAPCGAHHPDQVKRSVAPPPRARAYDPGGPHGPIQGASFAIQRQRIDKTRMIERALRSAQLGGAEGFRQPADVTDSRRAAMWVADGY